MELRSTKTFPHIVGTKSYMGASSTTLIIVTIILISKISIKIRNGVQHQPLTSIPLPRHPAQPSTCYRSPVSGALHGDDNDDAGGDDDENEDW